MIRKVISCDLCGTDYTQTNGWFLLIEKIGSKEKRISIEPMDPLKADGNVAVCGDSCLHSYVSQNSGRLHAPKTDKPDFVVEER